MPPRSKAKLAGRLRVPRNTMAKAVDPVCGMTVDTEKAPAKGVYDGRAVYFCAPGCQKTFEARRAGH
jgi:P-type Cu+ transporter